jgi:hypothetical protein
MDALSSPLGGTPASPELMRAQLVLRRASISRLSGTWSEHDYDVFDGDRDVGRIYQVDDEPIAHGSGGGLASN